jgi:hypothetical protein
LAVVELGEETDQVVQDAKDQNQRRNGTTLTNPNLDRSDAE